MLVYLQRVNLERDHMDGHHKDLIQAILANKMRILLILHFHQQQSEMDSSRKFSQQSL